MHSEVPDSRNAGRRSPNLSRAANYYTYHDPDDSATFSATVVHALADVIGVDVTEVEFSLYDVIDPDALDRLFNRSADGTQAPPSHLAFSVRGYRVTVYSDGEIVITPPH